MSEIILLAAYTKNGRVIGKDGKIPWNLKSERNRFKQICNGKKVIMGRKTFEEIGHGLPYCTIVIVSETLKTAPEGCILAKTLEEAVSLSGNEVLIAGGENIYRQAMPLATKIYATEINANFNGDRFFPELRDNWKRTVESIKEEDGISYEYVLYER